jgi:hypothetical protein
LIENMNPILGIRRGFCLVSLMLLLCLPSTLFAQTWNWTTELIDNAGSDSSVVADSEGNLHVSYYFPVEGQLKYAFRQGNGTQWFKMSLDRGYGEFFTRITADSKGNPYICYSPNILKFAHFDGHRWAVQQIDPGGGLTSYTCSVKIGRDGAPRVSWYVESGTFLRYATLKDGVWAAQTADVDNKPGKWNSLVLDDKGYPHLSYVTIFKWQLRYSYFDGKGWIRTIVDSPELHPPDMQRGMGNSLAFDTHGNPMISYYDVQSLKLAHYIDGKWKIETVEQYPSSGEMGGWKSYRSTLLLDSKGNAHIGFSTPRGVEHAWWDGNGWSTQLVLRSVGYSAFDCSMSIDASDSLYISYTDPADQSLRLAVGRLSESGPATPAPQKEKVHR